MSIPVNREFVEGGVGAIDVVLDSRAELAEGPVWDPDVSVLYWVNIKAHEIHRFDPATGRDTRWKTPADVGSIGLRQGCGMVVALRTGFFFFDPPKGKFTAIAEPEPDLPDNRFNDGKTDRQGASGLERFSIRTSRRRLAGSTG